MKHIRKFLSIFILLALVSAVFAAPVHAFDGRSGQDVTIAKGEVIEDDLYVSVEKSFTLDGTVKGDLIVFGTLITINGKIEGDLIAAGETIVINGTVGDDVRMAGAAMQVNDGAVVSGDVVAAGASIETRAGSSVGGELVVAGAQAVLSGEVAEDVLAATAALELNGAFGGDVEAYVDANADSGQSMQMHMYMDQNLPIDIPSARTGLTVDDQASIAGNLKYSSTVDLSIPEGAVGGKVSRVEPAVDPDETVTVAEPSQGEKVLDWGFNSLRWMATLILVSLMLGWLFPRFMKAAPGQLWAQPAPSLLWGVVAFATSFFAGLLIFVAWIIGIVLSSMLTLWWLTAAITMLGLLAQIALAFGLILITFLLTQVLVGENIGRWILARLNPAASENKYWPSIIGIVVLVLGLSLFDFPLVPALGPIGFLLKAAIVFFGFGALWLWGRVAFQKQAA